MLTDAKLRFGLVETYPSWNICAGAQEHRREELLDCARLSSFLCPCVLAQIFQDEIMLPTASCPGTVSSLSHDGDGPWVCTECLCTQVSCVCCNMLACEIQLVLSGCYKHWCQMKVILHGENNYAMLRPYACACLWLQVRQVRQSCMWIRENFRRLKKWKY